ncbi:MAG TPA: hypothetical protein VFB27_15015 [Opitutaceae bacterium]|nr:hypothetical protein [Opitutaceae bacterium]
MKISLRPIVASAVLLTTFNFAVVTGRADDASLRSGPARTPPAPSVVLARAPLTAQEFAKYRQMDAHLYNPRAAGADDNTVIWIVVGAAVVVGIVVLAASHGGGGGGGGY